MIDEKDLENTAVRNATHVKANGRIMEIESKWGIKAEGGYAKPSEGGFGVVTKDGTRVGMMEVSSYYRKKE